MSTTHTVLVPATVQEPRLSAWIGDLLTMFLRRPAVDPVFTADAVRRREADEVRALARSMRDSDPGFAADLYAAADRHASRVPVAA